MFHYDQAVVFYVLSLLLFLINIYFNKPNLKIMQMLFFCIAVFGNSITAAGSFAESGGTASLQNTLIFASLISGIIYLILNFITKKDYLGFIFFPVILSSAMSSLFLSPKASAKAVAENFLLYLHIPLAVAGVLLVTVSFITGIMYFMLERQLKRKKFGKIFNIFPPLLTIAEISCATMYTGFAFYTAGLVAATGWLKYNFAGIAESTLLSGFKLKVFIAVLAWFIFAVVSFARVKRNLSAKQTIAASVTGFAFILLLYAGVALFIKR